MLLRLVLLALAVSCALLNAQGTGGNITGQVLDPTGLGVPGARVTATNLETNVSTATTSSTSGNYNIAVYPFLFGERFSADFRWEAFNLLNRTRFSTGSQNLDSSSFGVVTSQLNEPRRMQLGLKLYW